VLAKPNGLSFPRVGIVVSKRTFPHAVQRNLVKRMARESFRHGQQDLLGLDIIVQLHRSFTLEKKVAVRQELIGLLGEVLKCLAS